MPRVDIQAIPLELREVLQQRSGGDWQNFLSLSISSEVEQQEEDETLPSSGTLQLTVIENASNKVSNSLSVKVIHLSFLVGVTVIRLAGVRLFSIRMLEVPVKERDYKESI